MAARVNELGRPSCCRRARPRLSEDDRPQPVTLPHRPARLVAVAVLGRWEVALAIRACHRAVRTAESHYFLSGANFFDFGLNIGLLRSRRYP